MEKINKNLIAPFLNSKKKLLLIIRKFCIRYIGDTRVERKQSRFYSQSCAAPTPIITVTEHTPIPSPDYLKRQV